MPVSGRDKNSVWGDNVKSKINIKKLIDINSNLNTQIYITRV